MKSQCKVTKLSLELINPICKDITSFCKIEEIKVSSKEIKLSNEEIKSFCEDVDLYLEEMKSKCEDFDASNEAFFNDSLQLKQKKNSNEETNTSPEGKDWEAKKVTIFNSIVCLVKTSETFCFFTCILPDYVAV